LQLASEYDTDISSQLATIASDNTLSMDVINTYLLIDDAIEHLGSYGLANVTSPVWSGNLTTRHLWTACCDPGALPA
jgi:hypothetical protein